MDLYKASASGPPLNGGGVVGGGLMYNLAVFSA